MKQNSQLTEDESRVAPNGDERAMNIVSRIDISCQSKLKKRKSESCRVRIRASS